MIVVLIIYMLHGSLRLSKWQFTPLFIFWVLFFIYNYLKSPRPLIKIVYISVASLSMLLSLGLLYAFPMRDIPDPSGEYTIGTLIDIINDDDRLELYTDDPFDTRRFMIKMWYPAANTSLTNDSKWIGNELITKELAASMGLPPIVLSQINDILSNSHRFIPMSNSQETYPVVIISHGWGGFMALHTDLAEELASRGYIVITIDHTYGSVATTFIDETVYQNHLALPDREDSNFLEAANQLVYTYAGDITKILDYLEEENALTSNSFFKGRLDLDHIGLIGHSTGGGADVAVALNDTRITALLGLDAWVEPIHATEIAKGLHIPSLFIRSETWEVGLNNSNLYDLIVNSHQASLYQINGTTHSDFTMAYMFSSLTGVIGITGSLESGYLTQMQKDIMNQFFDEHLRDVTHPDIDLTRYEELIAIEVS